MNISYNLRVLDESSLIAALIHDGALQRAHNETRQGLQGALYAPAAPLLAQGQVYALSDLEFRLGACNLRCQTYRLPPEEYQGLVRASPAFQQFAVQDLYAQLCANQPGTSAQDWSIQLSEVVRQGSQRIPDPYLVAQAVPAATWLPEETRLACTSSGWMLCLTFDVPDPVQLGGIKRSAMGIDLGLGKLAVGVSKLGLVHHAPGITQVCPQPDVLTQRLPTKVQQQTAQEINSALQYAAARSRLADFLTLILSAASAVYFEALEYDQMSAHFQQRSRELGVRDFSYVWMPKRLRQAGISFEKLPAYGTSQYCNTTHQIGTRGQRRQEFTDGNNNQIDADENAARNILDLGLAALIWGKPRAKFGHFKS